MDKSTLRVASYARSMGISVKAIAEKTGLSYQVLWNSFSGKRPLRGDEMLAVCDFLGKDPREFREDAAIGAE